MKHACDKCKAVDSLMHYVEGGEKYSFCAMCSSILEKLKRTNIIHSFMHPEFCQKNRDEATRIDLDMLKAREDRASGNGKWSS